MKSILKNWKTTICGLAIIVVKLFAAHGKLGIEDVGAITAGIGLIAATDSNNGNQ